MAQFISFISSVKNAKRFWLDPSFRYRCENTGLALKESGIAVSYRHLKSTTRPPAANIVVFHRPKECWQLGWLLHRLRRNGTICIADVDDLIFDPGMAKRSPGVLNNQHPLETIEEMFHEHYRAFSRFDKITVATPALEQHVKRLFPEAECMVIPNAVHESWLKITTDDESAATDRQRTITYLPGTHSHDRDFLQFAEPLRDFLQDHPDIKLEITGKLTLETDFPPQQLITRERVPFESYHQHLQHGWVNLMPLEDTLFNRCKSALKVIEAGYWNIPTLASVNSDSVRFIEAGAEMIQHEGEVYTRLERLLDDNYYARTSDGLKDKMATLANARKIAREWLKFALGK